jgi:hypothetical protein
MRESLKQVGGCSPSFSDASSGNALIGHLHDALNQRLKEKWIVWRKDLSITSHSGDGVRVEHDMERDGAL